MSAIDNDMIDPEIAAELDAIDATLAGDPVDPRYAEVAELALLLVAGRPAASAEFSASLDERVQRRFASAETEPRRRPPMTRNWLAPPRALATAGVAATLAAGGLSGSGRSGGP